MDTSDLMPVYESTPNTSLNWSSSNRELSSRFAASIELGTCRFDLMRAESGIVPIDWESSSFCHRWIWLIGSRQAMMTRTYQPTMELDSLNNKPKRLSTFYSRRMITRSEHPQPQQYPKISYNFFCWNNIFNLVFFNCKYYNNL